MKIGVVMGGTSSEREVSLLTGKQIVENLDKRKYDVTPITIENKMDVIHKIINIDVAILALHGKFGEDGTIQGLLESLQIPYTGSSVLGSALCMNKHLTKKLLRAEGINTPDSILLKNNLDIDWENVRKASFPLVVKPNSGGSSIGTCVAKNHEELLAAIESAFQYDSEVLIEQYIQGEEVTCSILNGELLPLIKIKPKAAFFDYASKYEEQGAEESPIQLEEEVYDKISWTAKKAYEIGYCSVYARVDMIIKDRVPYVLEINTLPGMTKNSLFPKSAEAAGISFSQLLDFIIEHSLCKNSSVR